MEFNKNEYSLECVKFIKFNGGNFKMDLKRLLI
jgi:hypothetical protein